MEKVVVQVVVGLGEWSQVIVGDVICQVVMVSFGGDDEVGWMIVEVMDKVSIDGVIMVEELKFLVMELEIIEGMVFDWGYSFFYFVIDVD